MKVKMTNFVDQQRKHVKDGDFPIIVIPYCLAIWKNKTRKKK